jgi:energy-coupling factor transport system ATP-binding protein
MDKIYLDHVNYIYSPGTPFERVALKDVTLGIRAGCITGIIGHTGSGKSTMIQMLNGLSVPTSGKIYLDGYDINSTAQDVQAEWREKPEYANLSKSAAKKAIREEIKRRRRALCFRVGLVMQYPEYQLFDETVRADIGYAPRNMGLSPEEIEERVAEAVRFVGLDSALLDKPPLELSGGEKRRAAIAGIIAMRPEILVLDEPAAGLDPRGKAEIFKSLNAYKEAYGATVILVSHSMEDMAKYCDNVILMRHNEVVKQGTVAEIFSTPALLEESGLAIPASFRLATALRRRGITLEGELYTVQGVTRAILAYKKRRDAQ